MATEKKRLSPEATKEVEALFLEADEATQRMKKELSDIAKAEEESEMAAKQIREYLVAPRADTNEFEAAVTESLLRTHAGVFPMLKRLAYLNGFVSNQASLMKVVLLVLREDGVAVSADREKAPSKLWKALTSFATFDKATESLSNVARRIVTAAGEVVSKIQNGGP